MNESQILTNVVSELNNTISRPLSDKDLLRLCDNKANLITHGEIKGYSDVYELMGKNKACIILYVTSSDDGNIFGHWTCVFESPKDKSIVYFDPYGQQVDYPLRHMTPRAIEEFGNVPILSEMLEDQIEDGKKVHINHHHLQHHLLNDNVCGRLTGLRLNFRMLDDEQFFKLMTSENGINSDQLSAILTAEF